MLTQLFPRTRRSQITSTAYRRQLACESLEDRRMLATFTVTSAGDSGLGTLRQALIDADALAGADRIEFDAAMNNMTISLTSAGLQINESVVIDATNLSSLVVDAKMLDPTPGTADGAGVRVFDVVSGDVEFHGLTIRGGDILGDGAAIRTAGSLIVTDSHFDANRAFQRGSAISVLVPLGVSNVNVDISNSTFTDNGNLRWNFGGGAVGGAIFTKFPDNGSNNSFTLQQSTLTDNGHSFSTGPSLFGGGLYFYGTGDLYLSDNMFTRNATFEGSGGGAMITLHDGSTATIERNSFEDNIARRATVSTTSIFGGGLYLYTYGATATVADSVITGNQADGVGGGLSVYAANYSNVDLNYLAIANNSAIDPDGSGYGGGIGLSSVSYSQLTMKNSTVSGNSAGNSGGGGQIYQSPYNASTLLSNVTVANNSAATVGMSATGGGGISVIANPSNRVTLLNTMIADNLVSSAPEDLAGDVYADFSLIEALGLATISGANNILSTDPMLQPLGDNGGATLTHAIPLASAALDAGDPSTSGMFDQRGLPRLRDGDDNMSVIVDIGAFELQAGANMNPIAQAGVDFSAALGASIFLDGTASNDPDMFPLPLTYSWQILSGPAGATLTMADTSTPEFIPVALGLYEIELTVSDGDTMDTDSVMVTVFANSAPTADATMSDTVTPINFASNLDGRASFDPDMHTLTFQWTVIDQPAGSSPMISVATAAQTTMFMDLPGRYTVELVVSDGIDFSAPTTVDVFAFDPANNTAPFAEVSPTDVSIFQGGTTLLSGDGSYDVDFDSMNFDWMIVSSPMGGDGMLTSPTASTTDFSATVIGDYQVELVVDDGMANSAPATVTIHVLQNLAPIGDVSLSHSSGIVSSPITINASRSTDPESQPLTYMWSIIQQPMGSNPIIDSDTSAVTFWTPDLAGSYRLELTVNDGLLNSAPVRFLVNVTDGSAPTANVSLSANTGPLNTPITLNGTLSSDPQMDPLTYAWSIVDQPMGSNPVIAVPTAAETTWMTDVAGTYRLRLVVNDGTNDSLPVQFTVNVTPMSTPTANVSRSENTGVVGFQIALDGTASTDPGMNPLTYQWSIITQPMGSNPVIADATAAMTTWTPDVAGTYRLRLVVNNGTDNSLPVNFLTNVSATILPTANVSLSQNSGIVDMDVTIDGSRSSDPNTLPLTYLWSIVAKPSGSTVMIADPFAAVTTLNANLAGEYRVRLIVSNGTDDSPPVTFLVTITNSRVIGSLAPEELSTDLDERDQFFADYVELS